MALARISNNQLFIAVLTSVYYNIHTYYENFLPWSNELMQENYLDLRSIIAAVSASEADKARYLAQSHVRRFNTHMEEKQTD